MELLFLDDLKGELDEYIQRYLPAKVKVIRNTKREGLIRGRMIGAAHATGISTRCWRPTEVHEKPMS